MILILSNNENDSETLEVQKWIEYLGEKVIRLNAQDFMSKDSTMNFIIDSNKFIITASGKQIDLNQINCVWLRRWSNPSPYFTESLGYTNATQVNLFLEKEWNNFSEYVFFKLKSKYWISTPSSINNNKLITTDLALSLGLNIPYSCITNNKKDLQHVAKEFCLITKPITNFSYFFFEKIVASVFTEELSEEKMNRIGNQFYPSLVQQKIDKQYEIRTFFLNGCFYSTAIFPFSNNAQIDIKLGFNEAGKENRYVPYTLPEAETTKLKMLLKNLNYDCCSIDLLKGTDGIYYFLEINPVGKFLYYSNISNYNIEKKIAELLIYKNSENEKYIETTS